MKRSPHLVLAVLATAITTAGGWDSAVAQTPPAPPTSASIDGLAVSIALDRPSIVPGEMVVVDVTVTNGTQHGVTWVTSPDPTCARVGTVDVTVPPELRPPPGTSTNPDRFLINRVLVSDPSNPIRLVPPDQIDHEVACDLVGLIAVLDPGQQLSDRVAWNGELATGYPALPGSYPLTFTFQFANAADGPDHRLALQASVAVEPRPVSPISPSQAVSVLLDSPEFTDWLESHPVQTWASSSLSYDLDTERYVVSIVSGTESFDAAITADGQLALLGAVSPA